MYKIASLLFLFICSLYPRTCGAQLFPQEDRKLSFRLIGFLFPAEPGAAAYKLEIAAGTQNTESLFEKNIISAVPCATNRAIAEVPSFGAAYTWRVVSVARNTKTKGRLHHFSTLLTPDVDTTVSRLRVMKSAEKYKDAYIFLDGARVLYDMKGRPVWFLPGTDRKANQDAYPRDLKVTPQGSITFLTGDLPYEITYTGDILWHYKGNTAGGNKVPFHHEFTRLANGHYMGMIYETVSGALPAYSDSMAQNAYDSAGFYRNNLYSSIVEYDAHYNLLWRWTGLAYQYNSDLRDRLTIDVPKMDHDLHENAFYFDEKNKAVYLSFRNLSRIIKIKYPEGNVLNTYGTIYKPGVTDMGNGLFCLQHCCRKSQKGYLYLYLYNNNTCSPTHIPTLIMMQEPAPGKGGLKKVWEYQCTVEGPDSAEVSKAWFTSGGGVMELPDGAMLAIMGKPYPKVFIVSQDKKILWSALPEKYDAAMQKWKTFTELYRADMISRKDLEKLIWNSEK